MKHATNYAELKPRPILPSVIAITLHALANVYENQKKPLPMPSAGDLWCFQHSDTDETVTAVLGAPIDALTFTKVRYFPDEEWFVCHLDRGEQEAQLVIPDADWLDVDLRQRLIAQL